MDKKKLHHEIENLIERIAFLNEDFTNKDDISQLEIDVLRKYCIDLYDVVNKLGLASKISQAQKKKSAEPAKFEKVVNEEKKDSEPILGVIEEEPQLEPTTPQIKEPIIEAPQPIVVEPKIEEKIEPKIIEPVKELPKEPQDKMIPLETQRFISSLMDSGNSNKSLFEKYKTSPIDSVSQGISVLKRFEYQSGLFKGNVEAYNSFLNQIETAGSLTNAVKILNDNKKLFNWEDEILEAEINTLVYRRYMNVPI